MTRIRRIWAPPVAGALLLLLLVPAAATAHATTPNDHEWHPSQPGAVFTMSNAVSGNSVIVYAVGHGGALVPAGTYSTGGMGTGSSLADSGALALTTDHQFLLVVNAGDNTISLFAVDARGDSGPALALLTVVGSGGTQPVSVTVDGSTVYVLDAGNATTAGNIAGFRLAPWGALYPIAGSIQPLSSSAPTAPAQISFNPRGDVLVVTEKGTNVLDSYAVNNWGVASGPIVTASNGTTPYGFAFDQRGTLIVSDAAIGALSSYRVTRDSGLSVISGSVPDGQAAPCWVAVSGSYAFATNAHGSTISTYQVESDGALALLDAVAATTGAADTDMAIAGPHGQLLFILDAGASEIQEFVIGSGGTLTENFEVSALPPAAEGLAAY